MVSSVTVAATGVDQRRRRSATAVAGSGLDSGAVARRPGAGAALEAVRRPRRRRSPLRVSSTNAPTPPDARVGDVGDRHLDVAAGERRVRSKLELLPALAVAGEGVPVAGSGCCSPPRGRSCRNGWLSNRKASALSHSAGRVGAGGAADLRQRRPVVAAHRAGLHDDVVVRLARPPTRPGTAAPRCVAPACTVDGAGQAGVGVVGVQHAGVTLHPPPARTARPAAPRTSLPRGYGTAGTPRGAAPHWWARRCRPRPAGCSTVAGPPNSAE